MNNHRLEFMKHKNYIAPAAVKVNLYGEDIMLTGSSETLPGEGKDDVVFESGHKGWESNDWTSTAED